MVKFLDLYDRQIMFFGVFFFICLLFDVKKVIQETRGPGEPVSLTCHK